MADQIKETNTMDTQVNVTLDSDFEKVMKDEQEKIKAEKEKKEKQHDIWAKQLDSCIEFFNQVAALLTDIYEVLPGKSRQWRSFCLVPKGTINQVTYYGKPMNSLRVAMNWNWRAGLDRCTNPKHIQCVTPDLPYVKPRPKDHPEWSSPPVFGNMVALFDTDNKYHCIFGEKFNRDTKTWTWINNDPEKIAAMLRDRYIANHREY